MCSAFICFFHTDQSISSMLIFVSHIHATDSKLVPPLINTVYGRTVFELPVFSIYILSLDSQNSVICVSLMSM